MSTKMREFYLWTRDIFTLQLWLEQLREKHRAWLIPDIAHFAPMAKGDLWDRLNTDTVSGANSPFNIDAKVVIYLDDGRIYVQFVGVPYDLYKGDVRLALLIPKHYQDSSDRPRALTRQEWKAREVLVERLLNKHDSAWPSKCGLVWTLADHSDCMRVTFEVENWLKSRCDTPE